MTEPVSLLDLRRKTKTHLINGGEHSLEIRGLSTREICDHLERFEVLRTISIGGSMTPIQAVVNTPGAAAAWVASACGHHRDEAMEQAAADNMTIEEISEVIEASMSLTFSKGFGPFSARLAALLGYITIGTASKGPDTRSPPPSPPAEAPSTTESGISPPDNLPPNATSISEISSFPPPT